MRGMHYQITPHEEIKLVRCVRGAIYDVIIDLREDSPTYRQWIAVILHESNSRVKDFPAAQMDHLIVKDLPSHRMLYIPKGFAHGFQTVVDDTEVFYQMSEFYHPEMSGGIRWDDPMFDIRWPISEVVLSEKDMSYEYVK